MWGFLFEKPDASGYGRLKSSGVHTREPSPNEVFVAAPSGSFLGSLLVAHHSGGIHPNSGPRVYLDSTVSPPEYRVDIYNTPSIPQKISPSVPGTLLSNLTNHSWSHYAVNDALGGVSLFTIDVDFGSPSIGPVLSVHKVSSGSQSASKSLLKIPGLSDSNVFARNFTINDVVFDGGKYYLALTSRREGYILSVDARDLNSAATGNPPQAGVLKVYDAGSNNFPGPSLNVEVLQGGKIAWVASHSGSKSISYGEASRDLSSYSVLKEIGIAGELTLGVPSQLSLSALKGDKVAVTWN